jgi:hypothetical protein
MKIYEIISENQNEGADGILKLVAKAPFKAIGKFFGSSRSELVIKLADELASRGKWAGAATPAEAYKLAKGLGPVAQKLVKSDPQILADAARQANKVRAPSLWNKLTGASKLPAAGEEVAKRGGFALAYKGLTAGLTAWGLYEMWAPPLQDYWESMDNAKANLDSGSWSIENYHHEENKQLSTLIGRLGAALLITSVPAMMLNNKLTRALLGKYLGGVLGLAMPAAVIYVRKWLNRDDNADGIAAIMMNDYIAGNGEIAGEPIPGLGSLAAKAKQAIMGDVTADPSKAKSDKGSQDVSPSGTTGGKQEPGDAGGTQSGGKQDIDSTSTGGKTDKPATGKSKPTDAPTTSKPYITPKGRKMYTNDPLALRNYDITGWVRKPGQPGWIMDPKDPTDILQEPPGWTPD